MQTAADLFHSGPTAHLWKAYSGRNGAVPRSTAHHSWPARILLVVQHLLCTTSWLKQITAVLH
jgi:hypothetical protein